MSAFDVLAAHIAKDPLDRDDLTAALAAVAELVEADRGYDAAVSASSKSIAEMEKRVNELRLYGNGPGNCRRNGVARAETRAEENLTALASAKKRRAAALAKFGGAR